MDTAAPLANHPMETLRDQVRRAVLWRSGSQIVAQAAQWAATFLVIRLLDPRDYGLYAMAQVVLVFLTMLNGHGLASALTRAPVVTPVMVRQVFGMLLVVNGALALAQWLAAPWIAAYYRQPLVAGILRVQVLLYMTTPFIALPQALLSRTMDFRHQARANVAASFAGAGTALTGALAGWGVWTLVAAPLALFATRGAMMTASARTLIRPSFDFRGAGALARFGAVMAASQIFWFLQSQTDVIVAGRSLSAHRLGIYTTALFLTQIFVAKIVPPLNEVAFSAYARIAGDRDAVARAFVRSVRIVMLAALPFYAGLAATAEPMVTVMLGAKWSAAVPIVRLLALAMPFMTLQILYTPACDACGRPGVGVGNGAIGAVLLTSGFLIGVHWGATGLAASWMLAYPLYLIAGSRRALPVIGAPARAVVAAIAPAAVAAGTMALSVVAIDRLLPPVAPVLRLAILTGSGATLYAGAIFAFARPMIDEARALLRRS